VNDLIHQPPHLERDPDPPSLDAWASDPSAFVWRGENSEVLAVSRRRERLLQVSIPKLATFELDDASSTPIARALRDDRDGLLDAYHRFVLPLFLQARGAEVIHASAVLGARGVVAFSGASGSGKSTLAYALSRRGFPLFADDTLAIERDADRFAALKLPLRSRLCIDAAEHFRLSDPPPPDPSVDRRPLSAICVIDRSPTVRAPELTPIDAKQSFLVLYDQALSFDLGDASRNERMLRAYFDLAERVPVVRLSHRAHFSELDDLLDAVLRALL
jgi:hypothetical protein